MLPLTVSQTDVVGMEKGVHVLARVMVPVEAVLEVKMVEAVLGAIVVEDAWVEEMEVVTVVVDVEQGVAVVEGGAEVDVAAAAVVVVEIN